MGVRLQGISAEPSLFGEICLFSMPFNICQEGAANPKAHYWDVFINNFRGWSLSLFITFNVFIKVFFINAYEDKLMEGLLRLALVMQNCSRLNVVNSVITAALGDTGIGGNATNTS